MTTAPAGKVQHAAVAAQAIAFPGPGHEHMHQSSQAKVGASQADGCLADMTPIPLGGLAIYVYAKDIIFFV